MLFQTYGRRITTRIGISKERRKDMPEKEIRAARAIKSKFLTLPGEELILVQRKHWSIFVFPSLFAVAIVLLSFIIFLVLYPFFPSLLPLIIIAFSLIFIFTFTMVLKSIVDWYFNLYIVTNRKITEVAYRPLSARHVNEVLLDQVRCTEIDTRIEGIINELLDVGDVIITFDRPTHQVEFVFTSIPNPKKIESHLHRTLSPTNPYVNSQVKDANAWYLKDKDQEGKWKYVEEIKNQGFNGQKSHPPLRTSGPEGGETIWNL
ncbi:MAG: hypothetical protein A3C30_04000 [Candidatus Levybacteria bacterium RIFCSPHIGHO2_02_FULL_40_18]|nr:MAG: hypothetical protein A2869_00615 [Candidatus Levybacteria bacterium RIFCSPHIGHO2_01_FULL_40_58]OGH26245.1 MAG: hypothetical protein A3C30_04000 [Candidatus Levybacteria bacterium RIFCSPHIGHO2_02_FULL_40_18]OGH31496.1 MAG: hypothetical protein A3E43_03035 [Candidatus Levybacteria bacterium RIFCSPHIGHO2_12_FULL_40_31]OGH40136.1 MAG: hypothetical protein A2894_04355 [Candidatus Levybacteria bacterium RIFCSPLOWO2_01_FULL_40_64]OGH49090.1 MAG: hypothetical protein A3I54_00785 [Candidatus Lev